MDNPFLDLVNRLERIETLLKDNPVNNNDQQLPIQQQDDFLSREKTAEFFGISVYTVGDWVKRGILKKYKAGNRTYFLRSELVEVLTSSNTH